MSFSLNLQKISQASRLWTEKGLLSPNRAGRIAAPLLVLLSYAWVGDAYSKDESVMPQGDCQTLVSERQVSFDFTNQQWALSPPTLPSNPEVGHVAIKRFSIFNLEDPEEDNWLFRGANRFHIDTRERTIKQLLLFRRGDPYRVRLLEESARLLREKNYLYDAQIFPYHTCGNRVDVMVVTRDVWTLTPGLSVSRSGGVNTNRFLLRDTNFLGLGKRVSLARKDSVDREGWEFEYKDPNLVGSRWNMELLYSDNDDGQRQKFSLSRPYYALDSRWRFGVSANEDERVDKLFVRGDSTSEFRTIENLYDINAGYSRGLKQGVTRRIGAGFSWQEQRFEEEPGEIVPDDFPKNREINQLWFSEELIEARFSKTANLNQIYRTEDINFGQRWMTRLGWADRAWGSDRDRLGYGMEYNNAWQLSGNSLLFYEADLQGFWDQDNDLSDDVEFNSRLRFYHVDSKRSGTFLELDLGYVRKQPNNKQLLLGGEENLRGYPLRYQEGDRRFLFTLEKRFYSHKHWYRLFRAGAAIFVDVGRAWFPGEPNSDATGVLSNVGFGLRLASSRAEKSRILHIDIAFPLQKEEDVDDVQIVLKGKQEF